MLKLERVLNVTALGDQAKRLNIEAEVRRMTGNLRFERMNLLSADAKQQLRDFAASDLLRVNFTAYSVLVSRALFIEPPVLIVPFPLPPPSSRPSCPGGGVAYLIKRTRRAPQR